MNARTALLASLLTLLLGAAAWWLSARPLTGAASKPAAPAWMTALDASPIQQLDLVTPDASLTLTRPEELPFYLMTAAADRPAWPVDDARVRSAARLLSESCRASVASDSAFVAGVRTFWRTPSGAYQATFSDATSWFGGNAMLLAEKSPSPRRIGADVARLFSPAGVLAWRTPAAMPASSAGDLSELSLQTIGGTISLHRSAGRWMLPEHRIAADDDAAAQLVRTLTALSATRLIGTPDASAVDRTTPTLIVTTRNALRMPDASGEVVRRVLVQELRVFGASDASGKTLFAVAKGGWDDSRETPLWGPMALSIAQADLASIPSEPAKLAARTVLELPAADIARLYLGHIPTGEDLESALASMPDGEQLAKGSHAAAKVMLTRDLDGWTRRAVSTARVTENLEPMLAILCKTPAAKVTLSPLQGVKAWLTIIPASTKGPHSILSVGLGTEQGGKQVLVVRRGGAAYIFAPDQAAPVITLLESLMPTEG